MTNKNNIDTDTSTRVELRSLWARLCQDRGAYGRVSNLVRAVARTAPGGWGCTRERVRAVPDHIDLDAALTALYEVEGPEAFHPDRRRDFRGL